MVYCYFSRDYFNNCGNFPMSQPHYEVLLQVCCIYSERFSLRIGDPNYPLLTALDAWKLPNNGTFRVCEETQHILRKSVKSVFDFSRYCAPGCPEDLAFFRKDGSVFMESTGHEGVCSLYPREDEDVSKVLGFGRWVPCNTQGQPEVPAKSVKMVLPPNTDIEKDTFYQKLRDIQQSPTAYLQEMTIEALIAWIDTYWPENFGPRPQAPICALPQWYFVFRMELLARNNALTTTPIDQVLRTCGHSAEECFDQFFHALDAFADNICRRKA